jgi:nicotinamide N-methyltransferase
MEFFKIAGETGWECEKVLTERFPVGVLEVSPLPRIILLIVIYQPMFPEDSGEEEVRSTVHGWKLTRVLTEKER